jgi:hypothetical protein
MKKIIIALAIAGASVLCAVPVQAAEISVVALPNPIGIPEIILVLAMLGFALWKKGWIRLILCLGIITWGIFFISYDAKVAAPLLGVGVVLFILGIMAQIQSTREAAE